MEQLGPGEKPPTLMKHGDSDYKKVLYFPNLIISVNAIFLLIFYLFFLLFPQSFEALSERAVAVVVDPIQSVKGKVRVFRFILWKTEQTFVKTDVGWVAFLDSSYL